MKNDLFFHSVTEGGGWGAPLVNSTAVLYTLKGPYFAHFLA